MKTTPATSPPELATTTGSWPKPGWDDWIFAFAALPFYLACALCGFVVCAMVDGFLKGWNDYRGVCVAAGHEKLGGA